MPSGKAGKSKSRLHFRLNLIHSGKRIFHGIFSNDDLGDVHVREYFHARSNLVLQSARNACVARNCWE
jgi:hypothetical protein